ncbi:hypothetical protein S83_007494 [Arachis hypogaea]
MDYGFQFMMRTLNTFMLLIYQMLIEAEYNLQKKSNVLDTDSNLSLLFFENLADNKRQDVFEVLKLNQGKREQLRLLKLFGLKDCCLVRIGLSFVSSFYHVHVTNSYVSVVWHHSQLAIES